MTQEQHHSAPARTLDVDTIVRAARRIVEREGLSKLTMRRLGRELDFQAMSIYHHVSDKAQLVQLVAQSVLTPIEQVVPGDTTADTVGAVCRTLRSIMIDHPELAPIIVSDGVDALLSSLGASIVVEQLDAAGFDEAASRWILESMIGFVAGHSLMHIGHGADRDDDAAFETGLRFMLAGLQAELGE